MHFFIFNFCLKLCTLPIFICFALAEKLLFEWLFNSTSMLISRSRPVITMDISIFLPASINITAPQCHDGLQPVNCLNVTACFRFSGKHVPGEIGKVPVPALVRGTQTGWHGAGGSLWSQYQRFSVKEIFLRWAGVCSYRKLEAPKMLPLEFVPFLMRMR